MVRLMIRTEPFPHIIWDNFLSEDKLNSVVKEFPDKDSHLWTWKSNDKNSIKYIQRIIIILLLKNNLFLLVVDQMLLLEKEMKKV